MISEGSVWKSIGQLVSVVGPELQTGSIACLCVHGHLGRGMWRGWKERPRLDSLETQQIDQVNGGWPALDKNMSRSTRSG